MSRVKVLPIGRALISGLAALSLLLPSPALAVTYGNPVENPLEKAPYVVSVWASESGDTREAEFICSGTLISSNIILTAAHCTDFENLKFFVKIKTVALMQEAPFYAATPWTGTRYDPGSKVKPPEGDIGLLRINTNITGVKFPSLANSQIAKKINKNTSLILMGWGYDQNKKLADTLRFSKLTLQDARSQKDWSGYFNIKTMISAGKFIKDEKKWSGSCNGDSGGPLLAELSGLTYVVGVTSWGHKQCRTEIPSVFSRVSYYERDIQAGIKAVDLLATSVNRLAPVEVIAPSMKGEGTPGTSLVCDPGTWVNAVSVEINWTSPSRLVGNTNPEAKVIAADIGQEFRCRILAKSKSGNSETTVDRYVSRVLPKKIAVASPPVIGGLEGTQSIKPGTTARCENWNWAEPVDQEVVEWFSSTSSNPSTPVNGKLLGTGREIRLTQELLKSERGRYLVCQLTGTRAGFPSYLIATKLISTADSPIINNVTVTAPSLRNGINASCSFSGTSNAERIQYEWGYSGAGNEFTAFGGQNADFIRITPQILKQASGQKLACKVTITNLGESVSRVGTSFEVFESELDAPKPSISVSNTPYVGSSASCSIPNSSRYSSVTYSWGITTSPDSGNFISGVLGNFRDLTFDSRILVSSAGNYITCVVTVANEISKAQGIASSKISVSAAPSLPSMSAPYISNQTRMGSQINVSISIPSAFGFDQSTMEAKLRLPGSNCDGNVLNSFPSTIVCSGLAGNRDYSVYTEVRYSTNSQIPSRQSSIGTFRTNDATAAPSISLSNATQSVNVNSAISTVNVSNSGGAVSSFSISPSLPIGLTFNSGTGSISGTPSQAQSQRSYTITATNSGGSSSATFTLTVIVAVAAPSISLSNATQSVNANSAISTVNVVNSGGAVNSFSISPSLPSGLTFNSSNGSISGTPTQAQSQSSYTITATNSGGSSSATFTLTVVALVTDRDGPSISTGSTTYNTSTGIVTGTFELVDGSGVASCRATIFNSNNVDVASTTLCSRVSGTSTNGTWQVQIDMQNSAFNPGAYTMKVSATDTLGNTRAAQNIGSAFTKPGPSVSNLGSLPIPRTIGINYLDQIVLNSFDFSNIGAAPGSFTWTVRTTSASGVLASSIPIGSNQTYITGLSPSTTYNVILVATDSAGGTKVSSPLTITTLAPAVAAPSISLSNATQSVNANSTISTVNISNSGGAVSSFSISPSLPSGLTFNSSNGSISGTPTQAQSQSSYTITATNSGGSSSATFTLTVVAGLVVIPITGGLPVASTSVGSNVVASFRATDGLGITNAWVRVWNSAENSLQGFGEGTYTANLISGNNLDGTYQATINTSVPGYANGGTFTVGVQIGGNNRITEWKVIGTFILSVPVSTIDTYPLNGVVIGGGRGGTWAFQTFDRASNLLVTAVARSSNGGPNIIAARFLKSRSESTNSSYPDEWQATFEVPNGTLNGTVYRIYWTLRNTDGTTREYSGGEFRVG